MNVETPKRKTKARPELSVFDDELNVPFNPNEYLPDVPSHVKIQKNMETTSFDLMKDLLFNEPTEPPISELIQINESSIKDRKQVTNGKQTGDKEETKQVTNGKQTGDKEETSKHTGTIKKLQTVNKEETKRVTDDPINSKQTVNKQVTNYDFGILRGHEANLLWLVFFECRNAGDLLTPPITLERIALELKTTKKAAKTITHRLVKKHFIERDRSGTGRGGYSRFRVEKDLYQEMLLQANSKQTVNKEITNGKPNGKPNGKQDLSSSSSSLVLDNFKTTTTSETEFFKIETLQLSAEWQAVDYSPLAEIGFTETHLVQVIRQGKLSSVEVQDSIHFFAFDLKRNGKGTAIHGSPLNFFMGILRRGQAYAPPDNFESPEAEARRKYLEGKRSIEAKRLAEEQELRTLEFNQWKRGLSPNDIVAIVPEYAQKRPGPIQDAALLGHFEKEIWPNIEVQVPGLLTTERLDIRNELLKSIGTMPE